MSKSWLFMSLQLWALLAPVVSAQDASFVDATFPAVSGPNYEKVLRLCYPVESQTNDVFMAEISDETTCDDYGGGDEWDFVRESTPASERQSRHGSQPTFEFPTVFDYFSLEAPDGRAIHFDSTPEALQGAERLVLGDMGEPKRYSKAIFTTGHRKRLPRYGTQRGRVFPGDIMQFIGSNQRAVGYYRLFTSSRHRDVEGVPGAYALLVTINAPNDDVLLLTATGGEEEQDEAVPWDQLQADDPYTGGAIGAGNTLPVVDGSMGQEEEAMIPATSRITGFRSGTNKAANAPVSTEPEPANNIITTEFVEEYPTNDQFSDSNLFAEPPRQVIDDEVTVEAQGVVRPDFTQEGSVGSINSLLEGAQEISVEDLIANTASGDNKGTIGQIGDRTRSPDIESGIEYDGLARAIDTMHKSQDPEYISEEELITSGFFPGVPKMAGLSESLPLGGPGEEDRLVADLYEDIRYNTIGDIYGTDIIPDKGAGVIGSNRGQQSFYAPQDLQVLTEQPEEVEIEEIYEASPELAQWNDDVNAIEDTESELSQPPGLGNPVRQESFDDIVQQIASTVSAPVDGNEAAEAMIGVEESDIDPSLRFALSSGLEEPLALLRELALSTADINADAQAFSESPRLRTLRGTDFDEEGIVPSNLRPRRGTPGRGLFGFNTESVPFIVPLTQQNPEPPEQPSIDSSARSNSRLSLTSSAFGGQPAAPAARRPLQLSDRIFQSEAPVLESAEDMPAQVLAPLLETEDTVIEPVVEPEEEKAPTVGEVSEEMVDNEDDWNVINRRPRPRRRKQQAQADTGITRQAEPDFWETMAGTSQRPSRNRGNGAGWSQNFGPNGQGGRQNYQKM
ncbi:hypothetical protein TWF730_010520 [Orbilia blumenaviensis]|uniref:Uncharacterized protein n=1 Tax=Orbilia blumenaviensis TaxID=1796055 RepID=A0AAV9UPB0_9PEZI